MAHYSQNPQTGSYHFFVSGQDQGPIASDPASLVHSFSIVPWGSAFQGTVDAILASQGQPAAPPPPPPPAAPAWQTFNPLSSLEVVEKRFKKMKSEQRIYNTPLIEAFPGKLEGTEQEGEIGLEIECEGMNLFTSPIKYWKTVSDGSLRAHGEHPPIEYVLRKPLPREDIPGALSYLSKKLLEAGSEIDDSTRTSVHVHLNCQKLTMKEICQIWCLYTIFEEMFTDFCGQDRVGNLFCLRAKDAEHNVQTIESCFQNDSYNDMMSEGIRYTGCNLASLGKFGSLEFRGMRGTVDQELIQIWIDILCLIRDEALKYEDPRKIIEDFSALRPERFLRKIFSSRTDVLAIFNNPEKETMMWDGMRLCRDVAYAVKWEKKVQESKKKLLRTSSSPSSLPPSVISADLVNDDCWLVQKMTPGGNVLYTLENWSFGPGNTMCVTMNDRTCNIPPREVYRLDATGRYLSVWRHIEESEDCPYEV